LLVVELEESSTVDYILQVASWSRGYYVVVVVLCRVALSQSLELEKWNEMHVRRTNFIVVFPTALALQTGSQLYSVRHRFFSSRRAQAQGYWESLNREETTQSRPCVRVLDLTIFKEPIVYERAMALQAKLVADRVADQCGDALILVEHDPVYTLGRGATDEHVRFDTTTPGRLVRVERGGDVTYHGPGQLVAYPVLHLSQYRRDSHWYLRALEEVVIRTCAELGLPDAIRHTEHTGVWLRGNKIAAVGVALRRWVTFHGLALNVNPDMSHFKHIVPCGLHDESVAALDQFLPQSLSIGM